MIAGERDCGNRTSRHAINFGGRIHLIDAVDASQFLGRDLAGRGLFVRGKSGEGKRTAGPDTQYAADNSLLTHAEADQTVHVPGVSSRNFIMVMPLSYRLVAVLDDLVEVGWVGIDIFF